MLLEILNLNHKHEHVESSGITHYIIVRSVQGL